MKEFKAHRPQWLISSLEKIPKKQDPTHKDILDAVSYTLKQKIADIESYNMSVNARLAKRIPESLNHNEIAEILNHLLTFVNLAMSDDIDNIPLALYVPRKDDIWQRFGVTQDRVGTYTTSVSFIEFIVSLTSHELKIRDVQEIIDHIRRVAPQVYVTTATHLYPVKNGIYNQKTKILEDFTPDYVYQAKMSIAYNPNATNPKILEPDGKSYWDVDSWIRSLAASDDINTLFWQIISASLQPNRGMNKSIWFYSERGNNGKGTMGQLIKNILGRGNYASLSVAQFKHEFMKEALIGAAANIADENNVNEYIDAVADYKASVTGDNIIINRKHKQPLNIQFRALNIQMMNGLPKTKDISDSFYRRLIIVPFIKSFTNNGEKGYIKDDYINRKEVLEYVMFKALQLDFEEFIIPKETNAILDSYKEMNNPTLDFWVEFKDQFAWSLVPKPFLYELFKRWFQQSNPSGKVIAQRTFFDNLTAVVNNDPEWESRLSSQDSNVRSAANMDADEPLITEYGLDLPQRDGTPSQWVNHSYGGTSAQKKRDFTRKVKYRGIIRK